MNKNTCLFRASGVFRLLMALVGAGGLTWEGNAAPPPGHPSISDASQAPGTYAGPVLETMNSGGYTYVRVDIGSNKVWAAGSQFEVKVGDRVSFTGGLPMTDFHSKTLNRDFKLIYFTGRIKNDSREAASAGSVELPEGHPAVVGATDPRDLDVSGIKKAQGGKTIEEIFTGKDSLAGKEVQVRGKVVKFSSRVMGKNWIHIKDGTGKKGADDLTVTTQSEAAIGDVVLVTGKVAVDRDFGYSYRYPVMLEEAKVTVE